VENIAFSRVTRGFHDHIKDLKIKTAVDVIYPSNLNDATPIVENIKEQNPRCREKPMEAEGSVERRRKAR
jgi:hypothetical protein